MDFRQMKEAIRMRWKFTARQRLLMTLVSEPTAERTVVDDLMVKAHMFSGTIYTLLLSLEHEGILRSKWGELAPGSSYGRRIYSLTSLGFKKAQAELAGLDDNQ